MSRYVGITRDADGLAAALARLADLDEQLDALLAKSGDEASRDAEEIRAWGEAHNRVLVGCLVAQAAFNRRESRGAHRRRDYPDTDREWRRSQVLTIDSVACAS